MRSTSLIVIAALVASAASATVELTPIFGHRQGTFEFSAGVACIALEGVRCPTVGRSEESSVFGLIVDRPVRERLDIELLVSRQPTEIRFYFDEGDVDLETGFSDLDVTHLHAGLRKRWALGSHLEPFGAFGVGVTWLDSDPLFNGSIDEIRGSASFAAGARVRLTERLRLRLETRGYLVDLPSEVGPFMPRRSGEALWQPEIAAGLSLRL